MKKVLIALILVLAASTTAAQTVTDDLVGLGMRPEIAEYIATIIPGGSVLGNNTYLKGRNQAGSADISVLKVDTTDDTELNSDSGDVIKLRIAGDANRLFTFNAASDTAHTVTFGDGGTTATQTLLLSASTSDTDDDSTLTLAGGGSNTTTRGAYLTLQGSDVGGAGSGGSATLIGGDNGTITLNGYNVILQTSGNTRWTVQNDGTLLSNGTNGGSLVFGKAGTGITEAVGTLAAAGTVQGDAAALAARVTTVTAADGNKGVILPATPAAGDRYTVLNTANAVLKIYPGSGDAISGIAANSPMSIAAYTQTDCIATSASQWYCGEPAVAG